MSVPLIFDLPRSDARNGYIPDSDLPEDVLGPSGELQRCELDIPQIAEPEVMRHFINLSTLNHHIDKGFYPLGSCTMKYNPKVNETISGLPGFAGLHPHQPIDTIQTALAIMLELEKWLAEITGLDAVTLQPAAGSHGELTGIFLIRAWLKQRGEKRTKILIPDSAHGTNPASIVMGGYQCVSVPSDSRGRIDIDALKQALTPDVAAMMITNPNTVGLYEDHIDEVADMIHRNGSLLYMDGANLNAMVGLAKPGLMGFDIVHINLHKTFSTPHGGGGPGAGPVAVRRDLEPFLLLPRISQSSNGWLDWDYDRPLSIGKVQSHFGNFSILIRAMAYMFALGAEGLKRMSETAILNANYVLARLKDTYKLPFDRYCTHEVVFSADNQGKYGVKAVDIAKRLLDFGFHAPTINFPLVIHEALMIEPTETETLAALDAFIEAMLQIDCEAKEHPELLHQAPTLTPVSRFDEAAAARVLDICSLK
ncbi:MAG: glycine dehydrogenase subunit 2 [Calditrichaeota bacterium]|nr:glycine dehydrogenase subunit 2 [Calditrichota bacterium]